MRFIHSSLQSATARMRTPEQLQDLCLQCSLHVFCMSAPMVHGTEKLDLRTLLRLADHGAGVVFEGGSAQAGLRQETSYPAYCWNWPAGPSFRFSSTQHINQLEVYAILHIFYIQTRTPSVIHQRFMHILDSRFAIMRPIAAFSVAGDINIFPLWTISQWNPADSPSSAYVIMSPMVKTSSKHLRYLGVWKATLLRYEKAMRNLFRYLRQVHVPCPSPHDALDFWLSERINRLWSDDDAAASVAFVIAAVQSIIPSLRMRLPTAWFILPIGSALCQSNGLPRCLSALCGPWSPQPCS